MAMVGTSPIPPDGFSTAYKKGSQSARPDYSPQPRVRPAAAKIHEMHKGSIGLMFGLDKHQIATGFKSYSSKNHIQLNVQKMRENQRKARTQQMLDAASPRPVRPETAALPSNPRYANVQSKVKLALEAPGPDTERKDNFLRSRSRPNTAPPGMKRSASDTNLDIGASPRMDFVKLNAKLAVKMEKTVPKSAGDALAKKDAEAEKEASIQGRKGRVPKYLKERKEQWEKDTQLAIANQPDPDMPPGHRKMPEAERIKNLKEFEKGRADLIAELQRMPIAIKSQAASKRKEEIEKKLTAIEEAIQIFCRPKVFVKIE